MAANADAHASNRWLVVTVRSPSEEGLDLAAEGLVACGASAVERMAGAVRTWLKSPVEPAAVRAALESLLAETRVPAELSWSWQHAEDWESAWRRGLRPRRVGSRLIVKPSWTEAEAAGAVVITIDPQMAFGTGEHASTRGVLRLLQHGLRRGDRVLDVGTGSGIVAIAAARLGAAHAHGVEADADALANAADNATLNGVTDRVTLEHAYVDDVYLDRQAGVWHVIVANVLSSVLCPLLPAFRRALRPEGVLILGGILQEEARDVIDCAAAAGLQCRTEDNEEEWWSGSFTATRMRLPRAQRAVAPAR